MIKNFIHKHLNSNYFTLSVYCFCFLIHQFRVFTLKRVFKSQSTCGFAMSCILEHFEFCCHTNVVQFVELCRAPLGLVISAGLVFSNSLPFSGWTQTDDR